MGVLRDIGLWLWRLLPANPIMVRVVSAGGKRTRHLWARLIYLVVLFVALLVTSGSFLRQDVSLAELAKGSTRAFTWVSFIQLFLMCFIAPVFTAGAITQEKDGNTFSILLATPLSNAQIVLGSLMSRLWFVWVLLLAGLPIFCITMIYGGVTTAEVFQSVGLAACTGLVTGSLAIMIGISKVGTRKTIFAFFLGVAVYLLAIWAIGSTQYGQLDEAPPGTIWGQKMSWLAPAHPFLALLVITGKMPAPSPADVHHYGWPWRWLLAHPEYGYMLLTTLASVLMVGLSLFFVRRGAKQGEATLWTRLRDLVIRQPTSERRRKPRRVWNNPIAWREAATHASTGRRSLLRWLFIVGGVLLGVLLLLAHNLGWRGLASAAGAADWLTAVVWIETAVILLVVTNTAASTLTREKESQTLELLLSTPLTSRYIVSGMLRGLVSFAVPLIAVPTATIFIFVLGDLVSGAGSRAVTTFETVLLVPPLLVSFVALSAMVGPFHSL